MRLIIAEKPSVAKDIAKVLGRFASRDGYLEGQNYVISWAIGHLVELAQPEEYNPAYKAWSMASLPIIPEEFRLKTNGSTAKQFKVVKGLLNRGDLVEVINACDAGREGELIFRYIYQLAGCNLPIKRLWISSLTEEAIQQGFKELKAGELYEALAQAARCRSESDWLVGINGTRGFTKKCNTLLSIGRVQTPTLAILVKREKEIEKFVPEPFWQVEAEFAAEEGLYKGIWFTSKVSGQAGERFSNLADAEAVVAKVKGRPGKVISYEQKEQKQPPPLLFDLTELQREMNKRYGFSASKTLKVAQSLYEEVKLITYPRTDSRYISKDMVKTLKGVIIKIAVEEYRGFCQEILALDKLPISSRLVNDKKVSDHHAIIPTGKSPNLQGLSKDQVKVYDAVVRRFLASFYPQAVIQNTTVITGVEEEKFRSKLKVIKEPGWRSVYGGENSDEDEVLDFPNLVQGLAVVTKQAKVLEKETKPPNRYTEASLLSAMETAGKLVEEEELREAMKNGGLGTPATRAAIIERLIQVGYIERQKKSLVPTEKGIRLIELVPVPELISPELTGSWEKKLADIQQGCFSRQEFMAEINSFVKRIVEQVRAMGPVAIPQGPTKAKGGRKTSTKTQTSPKKVDPKGINGLAGKKESKATNKATEKETGKEANKEVAKEVGKDANKEVTRAINQVAAAKEQHSDVVRDQSSSIGNCPKCGGPIIQGKKGYGCSNWKQGCDFVVWMEMAGHQITLSQVKNLLAKGSTEMISGFKSKEGRDFSARLIINGGKVEFAR